MTSLSGDIHSDVKKKEPRRCGSLYLGVDVPGVWEAFFVCVLGMCGQCSGIVYFRGWLRCVKWKAWSYVGRELVR